MESGTRLGHYEIVSRIGAGGMGEVFRARDTRLERSVAIKVLPAELSSNASLKLRFEREARAISQLNHPHICTLHDIGSERGIDFLVMELIDGESLADRIARGPLPLREVLEYGAQIAEALHAAHRAGIVHRDLKPGNIMITRAGAKLLDFGLAKSASVVPVNPLSATQQLETQHKPLTAEGTIVGTFQYMAPEQLEGDRADARTDVFALGCVLYEMLTGRRAFEGKTRASVIAAILAAEPRPLRDLQPLTPPALEHVIVRALEKDPEERWQSARDVARELTWIGEQKNVAEAPRERSRTRLVLPIAGLLVALAATLAVFTIGKRAPEGVREPVRFAVPPPEQFRFSMAAISPDGRTIAAIVAPGGGGGVASVWLRAMDELVPREVPGTERVSWIFWSPDSKWLALHGEAKLRKLDVTTGEITTIGEATVDDPRGGAWDGQGRILYAGTRGPIYQISASGGASRAVTTLAAGEGSHRFPVALPGGRQFLYVTRAADPDQHAVYLASFDSRERTRLMAGTSSIAFAPPDRVLFVRNDILYAQRLDVDERRMLGEPVKIVEGVEHATGTGTAFFSVSDSGTLTFQPSYGDPAMQWVDASGNELEKLDFHARGFELAPDGVRIAAEVPDAVLGTTDIWIYDTARRTRLRLTTDPGYDQHPLWAPDGRALFYRALAPGAAGVQVMRIAADGSSSEKIEGTEGSWPHAVSPDGKLLILSRSSRATKADVFALPLAPGAKPYPLLATKFNEGNSASFHPSGEWLAYMQDATGIGEVYVQRFTNGRLAGEKIQASRGGGAVVRWARDGRQLYFVSRGTVTAVSFDPATGAVGEPRPLFPVEWALGLEPSADGTRFLIVRISGGAYAPLSVIVGWDAVLDTSRR